MLLASLWWVSVRKADNRRRVDDPELFDEIAFNNEEMGGIHRICLQEKSAVMITDNQSEICR
jgi:hypothetical protein